MLIEIDEAQTYFDDLLGELAEGKRIFISRNGEPISELVLPQEAERTSDD